MKKQVRSYSGLYKDHITLSNYVINTHLKMAAKNLPNRVLRRCFMQVQ